jgi:hypothetical protein
MGLIRAPVRADKLCKLETAHHSMGRNHSFQGCYPAIGKEMQHAVARRLWSCSSECKKAPLAANQVS